MAENINENTAATEKPEENKPNQPEFVPEDNNDNISSDGQANEDNELSGMAFELAAFKKKAKENEEGWQRARAEFLNYKKRADREIQEARKRGVYDAFEKFLPIIDDFERSAENIPVDIQDNPWFQGIPLLQKKFVKLFEDYNVVEINPFGAEFDPNLHEAIGTEDSDEVESGHVSEVLQKGYRSDDYVIRPALVRVAN